MQRLQFDHSARVLSLDNLRAALDAVSGWAHRYRLIEPTSRARLVWIEYSNPDEYGNARPVRLALTLIPRFYDGDNGAAVVLSVVRSRGEDDACEFAAQTLLDLPRLWRDPASGAWMASGAGNMPTNILGADRVCPDCGREWGGYIGREGRDCQAGMRCPEEDCPGNEEAADSCEECARSFGPHYRGPCSHGG